MLEALGSTVLHVGTGVEGSSLKLAVNAWMAAATVAMSDVLALCDGLGIDHAPSVEALEAGPLAMPYAVAKLTLMEERSFEPGFAVQLGVEGRRPRRRGATDLSPLLQAVQRRLRQTVADGHGGDDLAAVDILRGSDHG